METNQAAHHEWEDEHLGHAVPIWLLAAVLIALLFLTFVTVAVTWVNLGPLNIWIALLVAVIKGGLVALYFMHLRWDSPFNGLVLIIAMVFVSLLIGWTLVDSLNYQPNYDQPSILHTGAAQ